MNLSYKHKILRPEFGVGRIVVANTPSRTRSRSDPPRPSAVLSAASGLAFLMGFRALIRVFQLLTCIIFCATIIASLDSWTPDPEFLQVTDGDCDFPIYNWNESRVAFEDMLDFPYIVRGANLEWPAFLSWRKRELLNAFGSRVVRSGSESSIVHSGGVAERESTLQDVVESMEAIASGQQDGTFIFDTTILRVIPELNRDFSVPSIFRKWDNPENETRAAMWHMLSLGPTQSGTLYLFYALLVH